MEPVTVAVTGATLWLTPPARGAGAGETAVGAAATMGVVGAETGALPGPLAAIAGAAIDAAVVVVCAATPAAACGTGAVAACEA